MGRNTVPNPARAKTISLKDSFWNAIEVERGSRTRSSWIESAITMKLNGLIDPSDRSTNNLRKILAVAANFNQISDRDHRTIVDLIEELKLE